MLLPSRLVDTGTDCGSGLRSSQDGQNFQQNLSMMCNDELDVAEDM